MKGIVPAAVLAVILILIIPVAVSADTDRMTAGQIEPPVPAADGRVNSGYNTEYVEGAFLSTDEVEILKAILVCVRDIDIYVQFAVVVTAASFLVWLSVIHPLLLFLK